MHVVNELKNLLLMLKRNKVLNHAINSIQLNVTHLRIFNSVVYMHILKKQRIKLNIKRI